VVANALIGVHLVILDSIQRESAGEHWMANPTRALLVTCTSRPS
jgi:hypothetical protein